ncbi:MAG: alpha/beta fold hydrolase [Solirubrobacterales bacterium]|nr:alpha/beta fold hydrolase [Solirubrobacterales bacterium]
MAIEHAGVTRHFIAVPQGTLHYAQAGEGEPILLLHQTPRSWDEFREVLPLLGKHRHAIAMDTVGFGDSSALPPGADSIEAWADAALALLDALDIEQAHVVGHHTGAVIAAQLAASAPERTRSVVLSSCTFDDAEKRSAQLRGRAIVDDVDRRPDGSHLLELWRTRAAFYPRDDVDLLERYMIDVLKAGPRAVEGHHAVARYDLEAALSQVRCPVLLIGATQDPAAYPALARLRVALPHAQVEEIEGGMVPLPDQLPVPFAAAVTRFLDGL